MHKYKEYIISSLYHYDVRMALRDQLGDTDHLSPLNTRLWYTLDNKIYIREDQQVPSLVTYVMLRHNE